MIRIRVYALLLSLLLIQCGTITYARDTVQRPAFSAWNLKIGRACMHDDYLSLSNYKGAEWGFSYERMRVLPYGNGRWEMRHKFDIDAAKGLNSTKNGDMIAAMVAYSYGQLYTWNFPCGIKVRSGGEIALSGGALYCPGNSNNPATAKAYLSIGLSEMVSYTWHIRNLPITFRYHLTLPVTGLFFSPAYGESYYEIFYIGNHSGFIQGVFWHNRFDMGNLFSIELPLGRNALRIGLDNHIRTSRADNTHYFHYSNSFIIGISTPIIRNTEQKKSVLQAYY